MSVADAQKLSFLDETIGLDYDGTVFVHLNSWLHLEPLEQWMQSQPQDIEFDDAIGSISLAKLIDQVVLDCLPGDRPGVVEDEEARVDLAKLAGILEAQASKLRRASEGIAFTPEIGADRNGHSR